MVEVDVFWAYGIGAGFALAAAHPLTAGFSGVAGQAPATVTPGSTGTAATTDEPAAPTAPLVPRWASDPYLFVSILYCAALFAPSGAWLLWDHTNWETMQVGSYDTVPGWLVALFAATNTTQGLVGYLVTRRLLRARRFRLATAQVLAAYFGLFFILVHGWDGKGYERFFSEDRAAFNRWDERGVADHIGSWVTSDVALTLYAMGVVLLPVMFTINVRWHQAGRRAAGLPTGAKSGLVIFGLFQALVWGGALGGAIVASVFIHLLGWILGVIAALALAAALTLPRRGPFEATARRFCSVVPPRPGPDPEPAAPTVPATPVGAA